MYPPRFAQVLRDHGHDAESVKARPDLLGRPDAALLALAAQEHRAIVTENARDFAGIAASLSERGQAHGGIILMNPRRFARTPDGSTGFAVALDDLAAAWPVGIESLVVWLQRADVVTDD